MNEVGERIFSSARLTHQRYSISICHIEPNVPRSTNIMWHNCGPSGQVALEFLQGKDFSLPHHLSLLLLDTLCQDVSISE